MRNDRKTFATYDHNQYAHSFTVSLLLSITIFLSAVRCISGSTKNLMQIYFICHSKMCLHLLFILMFLSHIYHDDNFSPLVQILFRVVCTEVPPQRNLWFNTRLDIILNVAHKICGPNRTHTKYAKWALIQRKACNIQAKHTDLHQEMAPFCIFIEQLSLKYSSNDI